MLLLSFTLVCYGLCLYLSGRAKKIVVYFYSGILIFFAGMRSGIGDTGFYLSWFNKYKGISPLDLVGSDIKEIGFSIFMSTIGMLTQVPQIYLLIVSFICIGFTFYVIVHYSKDIGMSLVLFLTAGFFLGMMNGVRQYLVVVTLFLALDCLLRNKYWQYLILVLILSTVHTSAIFMIPVVFFVQRPVWRKSTFILLSGTILIVLNISKFLPWLGYLLEDSTYSLYTETLLNSSGSGANIFRILVMLVPVFISFIGRKNFSKDDKEYKIYSNMIILNAVCYIFSAKNWIFARLGMYFHIYILLFYPYVLPKVFKKDNLKIAKIILIIMYAVYFLFEVSSTPYMSYYLNINVDLIGPLTRSLY